MLHADRQSSAKAWGLSSAAVVLVLAVVLAILATAIVGLVSNSNSVGLRLSYQQHSSQSHSSQPHRRSSVRQWQYGSTARREPDPADTTLSNGSNSSTVSGGPSSIRKEGAPTAQIRPSSNNYSDTGVSEIATDRNVLVKGLPAVGTKPVASSARVLGPTAGVPGNHGRQQQEVSQQQRQKGQRQQRQKQQQQQQIQQQQQTDGLLTAATGSRSAQVCVPSSSS